MDGATQQTGSRSRTHRSLGMVTPMTAWILALWVVFAVFSTALSAQQRCEFADRRDLTLPAGSLDELAITAGSGGMIVEGRAGTSDVRVTVTLCASSEDRLEALDVSLDASGSRGYLETEYPDWHDRGGHNQYARIDLMIEVPPSLRLRVRDGSGSIEMSGVGAVDIEDGSGGLELDDINGDIELDDGSGSVRIRGARGNVRIDDGSGGIEIEDVTGSVRLSDGSGQVDIRRVEENVIVDDKGSGTVDVSDVGGSLSVEGTRRERIRYRDVQGAVDLPPARRRGRRGN